MNHKKKGILLFALLVVLLLATMFGSDTVYNMLNGKTTGANVIETSAAGFGGDVKVATTLDSNGAIVDIAILDCSAETPEIGQAAAPEVAKAIVEAQSTKVDGVSGATLTSNAVKSAVRAATGETVEETEEAVTEAAKEATETETEAVTETATEAAATETEAVTETAAETDVSETEALEKAGADEVVMDANKAEGVQTIEINGEDVQVEIVTGNAGQIVAVRILDEGEADMDQVLEAAKEIVLTQTADVKETEAEEETQTAEETEVTEEAAEGVQTIEVDGEPVQVEIVTGNAGQIVAVKILDAGKADMNQVLEAAKEVVISQKTA